MQICYYYCSCVFSFRALESPETRAMIKSIKRTKICMFFFFLSFIKMLMLCAPVKPSYFIHLHLNFPLLTCNKNVSQERNKGCITTRKTVELNAGWAECLTPGLAVQVPADVISQVRVPFWEPDDKRLNWCKSYCDLKPDLFFFPFLFELRLSV